MKETLEVLLVVSLQIEKNRQTLRKIMSAISDAMATLTGELTALKADLAAVSTDIDAEATLIAQLQATITQLNNSPGTVSPADQALIDQALAQAADLKTAGDALKTKADALNVPTPPPVTP